MHSKHQAVLQFIDRSRFMPFFPSKKKEKKEKIFIVVDLSRIPSPDRARISNST
jgi:hypothetical protein